MKIDLPITLDDGDFRVVQAEIAHVAPHLPGTFAIHRGVGDYRKRWVITHVETGGCVVSSPNNKRQALNYATSKLATITAQVFNASVRKTIKRFPEIASPCHEWRDAPQMSLPKVQSRVIRTSFDYPPIPARDCDWSAVTGDYDEGDPIGRGPTETAAVADLLDQLRDIEEDE